MQFYSLNESCFVKLLSKENARKVYGFTKKQKKKEDGSFSFLENTRLERKSPTEIFLCGEYLKARTSRLDRLGIEYLIFTNFIVQEVSVHLYEKKLHEGVSLSGKKETITEILKYGVKRLESHLNAGLLRVLHGVSIMLYLSFRSQSGGKLTQFLTFYVIYKYIRQKYEVSRLLAISEDGKQYVDEFRYYFV